MDGRPVPAARIVQGFRQAFGGVEGLQDVLQN